MSAAKGNPMANLDAEVDEEVQETAPEIMTLKPKVSVALTPRLYYGLVEFCTTAAKARGKRVAHVDVFRALTAELLADEELRKRVINRLRGGQKNG